MTAGPSPSFVATRSITTTPTLPLVDNALSANLMTLPTELRLEILKSALSPVPYTYNVPLNTDELAVMKDAKDGLIKTRATLKSLFDVGNVQLLRELVVVLKQTASEVQPLIVNFPNPERSHWFYHPTISAFGRYSTITGYVPYMSGCMVPRRTKFHYDLTREQAVAL